MKLDGISYLTLFAVLTLGVFPFVPTDLTFNTVLFPVLFSVIMFANTAQIVKSGKIGWRTGRIISFLLFLCVINALSAIQNDTSISSFFRGLVPFLFLIMYEPLRRLTHKMGVDRSDKIARILVLTAFVWAVFVLVRNFEILPDLMNGSIVRLTYAESMMLVPFGMIGCILTIYGYSALNIPSSILLGLFLLLVVVSGYRSQIALVLAAAIFCYRDAYNLKTIFRLFVMACIVATLAIMYWEIILITIERFGHSAGDNVRAKEISYALSMLRNAPLFGVGLGHAVPVEITRSASVAATFESDGVPYIHNLTAYFLMNTGIMGTLLMFAVIIPSRRTIIFAVKRKDFRLHVEPLLVLWGTLVAYFHISASFRQIQMMVILALVLAVIDSVTQTEEETR